MNLRFMNTIMNRLFIIRKLKPLVVPRIQLMGLMFQKLSLILMTSGFNIQIINSLSNLEGYTYSRAGEYDGLTCDKTKQMTRRLSTIE